MDNSVENLTLDTLATREDFPTTTAYIQFKKAIGSLDRFYKRQVGDQEAYTRYGGRYHSPRRVLATIGWFENQSQEALMNIRGIGPDGIELIEALIEKKYQGRYEV